MSNEVYDVWETLERVGLLENEEHFVFPREGESLAHAFYEDVLRDERNAIVRAVVDRVASEWLERPATGPLLDAVYAMELTPIGREQRLTVRDIPKGEELLVPVEPEAARSTLYVDRGWLETLALTLVLGVSAPIHAAVADFRAGRVPRYAVDIRLRHRNGSWRWIHGEADLERNEKGEPVTMRGSHIDITERKQAEASAIELERQFRESQKMEAVGTLASSIAHDFNNIMGAILGNVALARADLPADHPAALSVAQIQVAGLRARSLVQKILSFTQRQTQQMLTQPLRGLVEEGIALLRATLPSGVTISRVLPADPLVALVDATQINQLLMNLGINAWHALQGQAGHIEVGLKALRFDAAAPRLAARAGGAPVGARQRLRHDARSAAAHLRALLHHQDGRPGHRPGAGGGDQRGAGARRRGRRRKHAGLRNLLPHLPAGAGSGCAGASQGAG